MSATKAAISDACNASIILMVPAVTRGSNDDITASEMTCPKPPPNSDPNRDVQLQEGGNGRTKRSTRVI